MVRMMLDDHRTPRCFWADAINIACYISNQIFLCSILHLTPFELRFGHKTSISHLKPFGGKCFVLKLGNLDSILLGYTPHDRSYRVFNLETNTIVESCDMTFDETTPCPRNIFECAGDKEMEEIIFVDEELQGFNGDEDEPLHHPSLFLLPHLKQRLLRLLPLLQQHLRCHWLGGDHLRAGCSLSCSEGTSTSTNHR
jgi:hypothetical protein